MINFLLPFSANFGLGVILGFVGGVFGIGGGLIAIPTLIFLYGMDQQFAQGTALVMIAPNVLLGFWRYQQRNQIDKIPALLLVFSSIIATYLTATYATGLRSESLRLYFAIFLIILACIFLLGLRHHKVVKKPAIILHKKWLALLGILSGICSGLFTIGGGLLVAPALTGLFNIKKQTTAQGYALATVVPGAFIALLIYAFAGLVNWQVGIPLAAGGIISISWGVSLAHSLPERKLKALFSGLLFLTAMTLLK